MCVPLENGVDDINPQGTRIHVTAEWLNGSLDLHPDGIDVVVKRYFDGAELVWEHPVAGLQRLEKLCMVP